MLGRTKQGVFSADFEDDNNTRVVLGDGDNLTLDCRVFLKQDKTVNHCQQHLNEPNKMKVKLRILLHWKFEYLLWFASLRGVVMINCDDCQISWLRHTAITSPDVLTVGNITYTGDPRISSSFNYPNNWRLVMSDVTYQEWIEDIGSLQFSTWN